MSARKAALPAVLLAALLAACTQAPDETADPDPSSLSLQLREIEDIGGGETSRRATAGQDGALWTWVVRATWTECPDGDFASYRLYRAPSSSWATDTSKADLVFQTDCLTVTSYDDADISLEQRYYYALMTSDLSGRTSWSDVEQIYTDPAIDTCSLSATSEGASARLRWYGGIPPDFQRLILYRDSLPGIIEDTASAERVMSSTNPNLREYKDGCCGLGAPQYYLLVVERGSGAVIWSNEASVTVEPVPLTVTARAVGLTEPGYVCFTSGGSAVCVSQCSPGQSFLLLDLAGNTLAQHAPEGTPGCLEPSASGGTVYAATTDPDRLLALDGSDLSVLASADLPGQVTAMDASLSDPQLYCTVWEPPGLLVLSSEDLQTEAEADMHSHPMGVCESPDGDYVCASNSGASILQVFDKDGWEEAALIETAQYPTGLAASQSSGDVHLASWADDLLETVDAADWETTSQIPTGRNPVAVAAHEDGYLYAACQYSDAVCLVDLQNGENRATVETGDGCRDVAVSADGDHVCTADTDGGAVSIIGFGSEER